MQTFGKLGEEKAASYLEKKGYKIIARNHRFRKSEIDLICKKEDLLIFVEVKTRSSKAFGEPESFVSQNQRQAIVRAAEDYVIAHDWQQDIRFDIVAIYQRGDTEELVHLEDAFY